MRFTDEHFTLGIEEEYLLVDQESCELVEAPEALMKACVDELADQVSPEFLQCQIEVGTGVCATIADARRDLRRLRSSVAECAGRFGLAPVAVSCHPFADWKDQSHTDKDRYNQLARDMGSVSERMLICGAHCHVGLPSESDRVDIMRQLSYFMPHLLALSTSSPYWQGRDTGLASYRVTVFDNMPRTGLPPELTSIDEYKRMVELLIELDLIEDSSKIWWDLRPSANFPTLETRICDVSPRLEDQLALAALIQCLIRMLMRLRRTNQRWRVYDRFLINENRWRAQRYGNKEGLIDFGRGEVVPLPELVDELLALVEEDAEVLDCIDEVQRLRDMALETSADRQRKVYDGTRAAGGSHDAAMRSVVAHLIDEFHIDL
ncbi:carboxylate-amine ligase [Gymnodinialimonas ceratoperidinii]|uniref:Putative glutamate--cysteine ligase 2 n=1 Tax=Gymnodinialimonas ceratoperidinii TaxID=2856823 RepID=A0A8F6TV16_9RHOB|nr:carboxylate-amine ligase [Gymnodinialimonas ceratoperidinii]QXT38674.1 carboxylate-amine ligase [Gymnodinialimonas ceratoperidinii]